MAKVLAWGKCKVTATPLQNTGATSEAAVEFPTPVEDSTQLTTTQGDKNEARVEGGAVEAVRYNANSYELAFDIRLHSGQKTPPLDGQDGVIPGEYKVEIVSEENAEAPKVRINRASANVQLGYTADGGIIASYTFSALTNDDGQQVEVI